MLEARRREEEERRIELERRRESERRRREEEVRRREERLRREEERRVELELQRLAAREKNSDHNNNLHIDHRRSSVPEHQRPTPENARHENPPSERQPEVASGTDGRNQTARTESKFFFG